MADDETLTLAKSPIPTGSKSESFVYTVRVSADVKSVVVCIWTRRTVFPVETKLVFESIKSNTKPVAVFPEFLIITLEEN